MDLKRSVCYAAFLLLLALLVSACGTLQVGREPTATSTAGTPTPAPAMVTQTPAPRNPTATPTEPSVAAPTPVPSPTVDVAPGWEAYTSERFQVTFRYPPNWQLDAVHGGESYTGGDGYFILDAIGSGGTAIDAVAATQASHHLRPYGTDPTIEQLEVQGQEARLILPSADATMGDQALLIVRYPQPVIIQGTACDHFALYADQAHIRTIAQTLQFVSLAGSEEPVSSPWEGLVYQTQGALWRIDVEGAPVQVFDDPQAVVSPDGAQVVTSSAADGDGWLFDLMAGSARRLAETPGRSECCYQWWPARPDLLLLSSLPVDAERGPGVIGHLTAVGLDGAAYQVLDSVRDAGPGALAPSPDGGVIAYGGGSTGWLYRWGQGAEAFDPAAYGLDGKGLKIGSPSWSPSGERLAWIAGGGLGPGGGYAIATVVFDLAAGTAQVLHAYEPVGRGGWPPAAAWSPDGEWLAIETWDQFAREPGLWVVHADGSEEHDLGRGNGAVWSPDGHWLALARTASEGGSAIWIAETDAARERAWEPQRLDLPVAGTPVNWIVPSP